MAIQKTSEPAVNVNDISRLAKGVTFTGELFSPSDIRIDGTVTGIIYSGGRVVVGETAVISGTIISTNLDFWGNFNGEMIVKDTISIKSTAVITGNLKVRRLEVEAGGQFNATCRMISEDDFAKLSDEFLKHHSEKEAKSEKGQPAHENSHRPNQQAAASRENARS